MEGVGKRLRKAMEATGFSEEGLSKRLGVNKRTFNHYLNDRSEPKFETLLEFCRATGVEVGDILRLGDDDNINFKLDDADKDFVKIAVYDIDLAAGDGRIAVDHSASEQLAFRAQWLSQMGVDPACASIVRVAGDSMEPTLSNGAIVLVDHRDKSTLVKTGIYAIRLGDDLRVKRIEAFNVTSLLLHSDNPSWPTEHIADPKNADFEVIGRVVWTAKALF